MTTLRDEVMGELGAIREQQAWIMAALKGLLKAQVKAELGEDADLDHDEWEAEAPLDDFADQEYVVPRHQPRAPQPKACPHNAQGILDGKLICVRCGTPLVATGVIQDRISADGSRIVHDPNPAIPRAGTQTHEASASGALTPHRD